VVPNILPHFPCEVGKVLGRALLWASFDAEMKAILLPALLNYILMAYAAIRVTLVIMGDDDKLNIEEIGGPDDADANQQAARRQMGSTSKELLGLHTQNTALHCEIEELRTQQSL
jgi:hypothetical protein